jgi:hypothetical protein
MANEACSDCGGSPVVHTLLKRSSDGTFRETARYCSKCGAARGLDRVLDEPIGAPVPTEGGETAAPTVSSKAKD